MADEERESKRYYECDADAGRHFYEKKGNEISVECQCGKGKPRPQMQ